MIIWGILLAFLVVVELMTPIALVGIWFMPGVVLCGILSLIGVSYTTQMLTFGITTLISTITFFVYLKKKSVSRNVVQQRFSGRHVVFMTEDGAYAVRIKDVIYQIVAIDDTALLVGDVVTVCDIVGNKLTVKKVER